MFTLRHWIIALSIAAAAHTAALAFATIATRDEFRIERAAGPSLSVVGSTAFFNEIKGSDADSQEIKSDTNDAEITEVEPLRQNPDAAQALSETPPEELKDTPEKEMIAALPQAEKPRARENPKKKKLEAKKPRQKQKTANSKASRRGGKRTAAEQTGGGRNGSQRATSGRASSSNFRGRVRAHLARHKRRVGSKRGTAVIAFTVTASGSVTGIRLARRSGVAAIDKAAIAMVRRASPFPSIPPGLPRRMNFTIPFHVR